MKLVLEKKGLKYFCTITELAYEGLKPKYKSPQWKPYLIQMRDNTDTSVIIFNMRIPSFSIAEIIVDSNLIIREIKIDSYYFDDMDKIEEIKKYIGSKLVADDKWFLPIKPLY